MFQGQSSETKARFIWLVDNRLRYGCIDGAKFRSNIGDVPALAEHLGISRNAIYQWSKIDRATIGVTRFSEVCGWESFSPRDVDFVPDHELINTQWEALQAINNAQEIPVPEVKSDKATWIDVVDNREVYGQINGALFRSKIDEQSIGEALKISSQAVCNWSQKGRATIGLNRLHDVCQLQGFRPESLGLRKKPATISRKMKALSLLKQWSAERLAA